MLLQQVDVPQTSGWSIGGLWTHDGKMAGRVWHRSDGLWGAIVLGHLIGHHFKSETEAREYVEATYALSV